MLKGYKYNQSYKHRSPVSKYNQEQKLIQDFAVDPNNENICFEYGSVREATNARQSLVNYVTSTKKQLIVMQRDEFVFVVRKEGKTNEQG